MRVACKHDWHTLRLESGPRLKIVIFPLGWVLAHVGRTVEIAKALRARGHEVVFAGEDPDHPRSKLHLAREAGFRVAPVKEPRQYWAWDRFERYGWWISVWDCLRARHWAPIDDIIEDIVRVVREENPDLIVGDGSVGVSTAGHITGTAAAGVMNAYNSYFYRPGSFFRAVIMLWDTLILRHARGRVYQKNGVRQINAMRLLQSIPLISPDLPEFFECQDEFQNWHAVGPIVFEPAAPLPEWYSELGDGTPNVYITMGSTGLLDQLLRRTYDDLARTPYRFIVTTAGQVTEETMDAAPDNFRFTKYAPGSALLKHASALVFHGGNGTLYQALAEGVPMIALPSHLEQEVGVRMAIREGFCLRYSPRRVSGRRLAAAIQRIIEQPAYRENARRFTVPVRSSRGADHAAEIFVAHALAGLPAGSAL